MTSADASSERTAPPPAQPDTDAVGLRGYRLIDPDRTANRRREVVRAAARVFGRNGYHASTTDDVAQEMGVSKGVVYYYFRSKEEILFEVLITAAQEGIRRIDEVIAEPLAPTDVLRKAVVTHLLHTLPGGAGYESTRVASERFQMRPERQQQLRALQREYFGRYESIVRKGTDAGMFVARDVAVTTRTILTTIDAVIYWFRPHGRLSAEEIMSHVADQIMRGVVDARCLEAGAQP